MIAYLGHLLIGFGMSYLGLLPPGMLNMTAVKQSIDSGFNNASLFSAGAATTVGVQASIALVFAQLLQDNPAILRSMEYLAIPIFILLAFYFYRMGINQKKPQGKQSQRRPYISGLFMSALNTISIPFYFGYCTLLSQKGWIEIDYPYLVFIVIGAALGAFTLFLTYAKMARYIVDRIGFIARNINFILSGFFVLLALTMIIKSI